MLVVCRCYEMISQKTVMETLHLMKMVSRSDLVESNGICKELVSFA